jgi:UDP-N-acetylglucosamine 2-epimerase (non-hydrolysing)
MKVLTVLGTRPEIIRLSRIIDTLDRLCDHVVVHTGQNFDERLSDIFFRELGVRAPDRSLGARGDTFGEQVAAILAAGERVLLEERPDRVVVLGDTNSGLVAFIANRLGIPVYHLEAGNRCFDDRVPEEVNRRVIDHCSTVLMPYTERSRANLLREGIEGHRIHVVGNPINEVLRHHEVAITASDILDRLGLAAGRYLLVTMHRQENVDEPARLRSLTTALHRAAQAYGVPVVGSLHPRTHARMEALDLPLGDVDVRWCPPFGFFDFVALERHALCVLSDSGTVQEECCILKVANVTIRDVTERPETLECGSNMLSGADADDILRCMRTVLLHRPGWDIPREYLIENTSQIVARIVLGHAAPSSRTH